LAAISPDGRWIAEEVMGGGERNKSNVVLWNLTTGEPAHRFAPEPVYQLAFSPDSRWLAMRLFKSVELFEAATGKRGPVIVPPSGSPEHIAFSPDSRFIAGADHNIVLWDVSTGKQVGVLNGPEKDLRKVAISRDGRWIAGAPSGYLTLLRRVE
jgi:WD40 repeat protein